ncbi:nitrilase-related carbon-nitrogen hydrolase [Actinotalea fermentans]|uniref:Hydrolase n=1 Tax=Actinotalea fermentans TaxID=43671 RepID=A0A511YXE1_9CELL|nr:nitrilase-related carbon-nitrogen hydrolase [Actinotalea fermentans]KGM17650.1 acyltransferase [Actinotalea fermentans ATCC 43279 = JCM 9966 = DSM 3133]GEN79867.1 hydrolase [Actinotalea fermentans]
MTVVRAALIQTVGLSPMEAQNKHNVALIEKAVEQGAQVVCLQELSTGPYFCQVEDPEWFDLAESVPDGPTTQLMMETARRLGVVLVVPLYEKADNFYYNTAVVIDADGTYLGMYRKNHIPHGNFFYEKYYFKPGNLGYPVFDTAVGRIGVYICYDRHFPEGARALGIAGAQIVFIPSATAGESREWWLLEQRAHAKANGYYVATNNRVGLEDVGPNDFYGLSYVADPNGTIIAQAGSEEEILLADLDLTEPDRSVMPNTFWRDRRPDTYDALVAP